MAMSSVSTVHGGQYDAKYVTFELLVHAAFVADEIWGFMLEPARIYSLFVILTQLHELIINVLLCRAQVLIGRGVRVSNTPDHVGEKNAFYETMNTAAVSRTNDPSEDGTQCL